MPGEWLTVLIPATCEAEAGRFRDCGQPGQLRENLSQNLKNEGPCKGPEKQQSKQKQKNPVQFSDFSVKL